MASKINVDKIARNSGTPEFTIPTADGAANTFLKTDGSGVLSFAANLTYDGNTLDVKNAGTASSINLYCESSNAHYTKIKSGPHASATSYTITLPNAPPSVSGQVLSATTAGVASWATASDVSGLASVQTFTSSGTWTRPAGITKVIMEVQAAGGSGSGSANTEDCQGGGGGGYAKKFLDVSSISTSTITVGAGGAGVAGNGTNAGNIGGASSWADGTNTITGNGGGAGETADDTPTIGGTATGGDINIQGGDGASRYSGSFMVGGGSMLGFGGMPKVQTRTIVARPPRGYGAGSGASHFYSGTVYNSENGGAGIVIVWEYK